MSGTALDPVEGLALAYRVRFDECGPDGLARTSVLLRYAQDLAWAHSEALGFDRAWYAERGLAWVVRAAELAVLAPIPVGSILELTTRVTGFRRAWARRRTDGRLAEGRPVAWLHTDWVVTDARGLPARVPQDFPARFAVAPASFEPGRVPLPETPPGAQGCELAVRPQDLDPMGHVNNAAYLDYLEETLLSAEAAGAAGAAEALREFPRRLRVEYLRPARAGDRPVGRTWPADDDGGPAASPGGAWAWRLVSGEGTELARARITAGR